MWSYCCFGALLFSFFGSSTFTDWKVGTDISFNLNLQFLKVIYCIMIVGFSIILLPR